MQDKLSKYISEQKEYSDFDGFFDDPITHKIFDVNEFINDFLEQDDFLEQLGLNSSLTDQNYTIYIPSKGRPNTGLTYKHCIENGLKFKVVVEPQDYEEYSKYISKDNLLQLDKNNQGIQYARTFIKKYSQSCNESHHWQMDDDMRKFTIRKNSNGVKKNTKTDLKNVICIVEYLNNLFKNIAITGITSNIFAFSKPLSCQINRLAYGVVLVNNSVDLYWRKDTVEDWDYTLNCLEAGYCTLVLNHINFDTPSSGSNSGGNQMTDWETIDKRREFYEKFCNLWPDYFECVKITGEKSVKGYKLKHKYHFFNNYKQQLKIV